MHWMNFRLLSLGAGLPRPRQSLPWGRAPPGFRLGATLLFFSSHKCAASDDRCGAGGPKVARRPGRDTTRHPAHRPSTGDGHPQHPLRHHRNRFGRREAPAAGDAGRHPGCYPRRDLRRADELVSRAPPPSAPRGYPLDAPGSNAAARGAAATPAAFGSPAAVLQPAAALHEAGRAPPSPGALRTRSPFAPDNLRSWPCDASERPRPRRLPADVLAKYQNWVSGFQGAYQDLLSSADVTFPAEAEIADLEAKIAALQASSDPQALFLTYVEEAINASCKPSAIVIGEHFVSLRIPAAQLGRDGRAAPAATLGARLCTFACAAHFT